MVSTFHTKPEPIDIIIWNLVIKLEFVELSFCEWKKGKLEKSSQFDDLPLAQVRKIGALEETIWEPYPRKKSTVADFESL